MKIITLIMTMLAMMTASGNTLANAEVEIYLIRHGKTMFNTTNQVQGWADSPLTNIGIEQAIKAGKGLKDLRFAGAYSSDSGRAINTARLILEENKSRKPALVELSGLREWGYGGYEGRDDRQLWTPLFKQVGMTFKKDWSNWEEFTQKMTDRQIADSIAENDPTKTAENYDAIITRSKAAIDKIVADTIKAGGGKVLVVTHGSEIPTILEIYAPGAYKGQTIGNASLTTLKYKEGHYTLGVVGDLTYQNGK